MRTLKNSQWLFWAWACVLLLCFQYMVLVKEKVIESGDILLLELAPLDPRSFMQGDYMSLRYDIESQLGKYIFMAEQGGGDEFLVVNRDENKVARLAYDENGDLEDSNTINNVSNPLAENEWLIPCKINEYGRPYIPQNTFFFQEGQAATFAAARYAVFRCTKEGVCLLVDLADETGKALSTQAKLSGN